VTFKTYLSTLKFCLSVWLISLVVGFFVAYFLAFHVRSTTWQIALFLGLHRAVLDLERHPHDLVEFPCSAANGLVNSTLIKLHFIDTPIEWADLLGISP